MTNIPRGVPAYRSQSYASLEKIARRVRSRIAPDIAIHDALRGVEIFEGLDGYQVTVGSGNIPLKYGVESLPLGFEAHAHFSSDEGAIVVAMAEETYGDLEAGVPRALFTLAHEIGHAVLHAQELVDRGLGPPSAASLARPVAAHRIFLDTEWQANGFASALLIPAEGLRFLENGGANLDEFLLQEQFSVSRVAAEVRLKTYRARRHELTY
jgi:hypothetical protein